VRVAAAEDGQREDAAQLLYGLADGVFEITLEIFLDEVRDDLGIGLSFENVPFILQLFLQGQVIFDNAVVDDDDVAGAVAVGVGVFFGWAAVGRPTGVSDAVAAVYRVNLEDIFEIPQFSGGAADAERLVIAIDGDTGGVVTAVFEPFETIQNDRNSPLGAYVAYDSTHVSIVEAIGRPAHSRRTELTMVWSGREGG
jgi:hypothetical protein